MSLYSLNAYESGKLKGKLMLANRCLELQADEIAKLESNLARSNDLLTQWLKAHGGDDTDVHIQTVEFLARMQREAAND